MLTDAKLPTINDPRLQDAMTVLDCDSVALIPIIPKPHAQSNRCHANVELYVNMYGGKKITGYYVAVSEHESKWTAIKHSVWDNMGNVIDITPVDDGRTHNVFIWGSDRQHTDVYCHNGQIIYNDQVIYEDTFKL